MPNNKENRTLSVKFALAIARGDLNEVKNIYTVADSLDSIESLFHTDVPDPITIAYESKQVDVALYLLEKGITKFSPQQYSERTVEFYDSMKKQIKDHKR